MFHYMSGAAVDLTWGYLLLNTDTQFTGKLGWKVWRINPEAVLQITVEP